MIKEPRLTNVQGIDTDTEVALHNVLSAALLITFSSAEALAGSVTVQAQVLGGTALSPIENGVVDLTSRNYLYVPNIPVVGLHLNYDGEIDLNANIYQLPNRS